MLADRIIFVCIIALAGVYFWGTAQIPSLDIGDPLGPKAFPRLLGIGLLITAGLLLGEMLRNRSQARAQDAAREAAGEDGESRSHLWVIGGVAAWTAGYFAVFQSLGYIVATTLFLFALMAWFNRGRWLANALTSVLFTLGSWVLFVKILGVNLARGLISF